MQVTQKITPCLWLDDRAEEADAFYTGIFKNQKILNPAFYREARMKKLDMERLISSFGQGMPSFEPTLSMASA